MLKINNPHIPISIGCFLLSLLFPGYYIGDRFEPQLAYGLLLSGWLGLIGGHFAWFANPLFLIALLTSGRPSRSGMLAFLGLVFALSFLLYEKIVINAVPSYSPIVAYGWGYGLWVTSLAVLTVGQLLQAHMPDERRTAIASISTCALFVAVYATYYVAGKNSLFSIHSQRIQEFESRCALAGEKINKRSNDVKGIFFDPDWEWSIGQKYDDKPDFKYISGVGVIGLGHLNSGHLLFYETKDEKKAGSYLKYVLGEYKGSKSDRLESEYAVTTVPADIPARLNIFGATVTITDRRDDSVMATATFFLENESGAFCGNPRGSFSTSQFITEVLGLSKKYPSVFK